MEGGFRLSEKVGRSSSLFSDEGFKMLFFTSPHPIGIVTAARGEFVAVNPAHEAMFGYRQEELIGRTVGELNMWVSPDERDKALQLLEAQGGTGRFGAPVRTRDGKILITEVSMGFVAINGEPCLITTFTDVTELRWLRSEVARFKHLTQETD